MAGVFKQTHFNMAEAKQGFITVYTPSIKYPLTTTSISRTILQNLQKPVIQAVLSRMGFNNHMPRALVYAYKRYGGIGLLDLYSEQSLSQVNLLITHLRSISYLRNTLIILLETYQIASGYLGNPLENFTVTTNVHSPWIQSIRAFLNNVQGKIIIPELATTKKLRQHDKAIMELAVQGDFLKSELECINTCRIFLQVTSLAEITNDRGDMFLPQVTKGQVNQSNQPKLHKVPKSLLSWPVQTPPSTKAWRIWKQFP
jgi:hypothetical protein